MNGVDGIMTEGSAFIDSSFQKGLQYLLKSIAFNIQNIFVRELYLKAKKKQRIVVVEEPKLFK